MDTHKTQRIKLDNFPRRVHLFVGSLVFIVVLIFFLGFGEFFRDGVINPSEVGFPLNLVGVFIFNGTDYQKSFSTSINTGDVVGFKHKLSYWLARVSLTRTQGRWGRSFPEAIGKFVNPRTSFDIPGSEGVDGFKFNISGITSANIGDIYPGWLNVGVRDTIGMNATDPQAWTVGGDESLISEACKFTSGTPQGNSGYSKDTSEEYKDDIEPEVGFPLWRRFIVAWVCLLGAFGIARLGMWYDDRGRKVIFYMLFVFSSCLVWVGLILFFLTRYRWSWGWWL